MRECISLVFETARPDVNERRSPEAYRPRQQRKQQHRRHDARGCKTCLMLETKRAIKPSLTRQPRDRGECHKDASYGKAEQLQCVALFVMPNFVCEHGFHFRLGELRDVCVEQDDFSKTSEPSEEGVRVARAFAAINYLDDASEKVTTLRESEQGLEYRSYG